MLKAPAPLPFGEHTVFFPETTMPLRSMLGSVGHTRTEDPRYNWHGLKRGRAEFSLFQYTLAGAGRLRLGAQEWPVPPGTAMLLHFPDDNQYWLPPDSGAWEFIYVCLHGREVSRLWRSLENRLGARAPFAPEARPVQVATRVVAQALAGRITNAFAASALAYELTMALAGEMRPPRASERTQPALERARQFAETHLAQPLTVDDLAAQAGLSRYHFSRLFAAHTGLPPATWLVEQRVKEAARLLRGTRLTLKEIAAQCGFPNPNYLGRVFQRQTGMPPATYRRSGA
ncbi:MAG: helix-turn-helix domain-containing protein [Opitutales bacterium]